MLGVGGGVCGCGTWGGKCGCGTVWVGCVRVCVSGCKVHLALLLEVLVSSGQHWDEAP